MTDNATANIRNFLTHIASTHSEAMPAGANALLQALIACSSDAMAVTTDNVVGFTKEAVKARNAGVSDDSLRKRIQFFNRYCTDNKIGLQLKSRKHQLLLEIDPQQFDLVATQKMVQLSQHIADEFNEKPAVQPELRPEPAVFISHKWHDDQALRNIFHEFCQQLDQQLSHPPEGRPSIRLFYSTSQQDGFKPDSDRQTQQDSWCQQAFLGLILWSQFYDHSDACQCELKYFIDNDGKNQAGKKAIVLLDHGRLQDMPKRLQERNAFFYPPDNEISLVEYWENGTLADKGKYIAALCDKIHAAWTTSSFSSPAKQLKKRLDLQLIRAGEALSAETLHDEKTQQPEAFEKHERIELIPVLKSWANDFGADSTRVSVLLGDFGFGKTVSCRLLNKVLSDDYQQNPAAGLLPLYLDLKALQADIAEHKSKPIEHLLEAMLQKTGEKLTVSGEAIIQYIRANCCLVIFDGFDEIGHHLNEAEQQAVYASLLDIIPRQVYLDDAARWQNKAGCRSDAGNFPSKLLISCRTHFFNKLAKEESFISGSERHAIGAHGAGLKNIRRFYMAPFSAQAIENYLNAMFGNAEGQYVRQMLNDIHDLSELSSHPIMLDMITRQLPLLKARQEAGKTINSAVLYLRLFELVGERDTGKHKIRLNDKQELLAALALHLWRKQQTSIGVHRLDQWFAEYGSGHRTIKLQLTAGTHAMQELMQDLCNASLLVREQDRYRFAHTSYLEFFIALGLFEAIRRHRNPKNFAGLLGDNDVQYNRETLQFLLNWRELAEEEDREQFDQRFVQLLESDSPLNVREFGFTVWKFGQLHASRQYPFPHSPRANWSQMRFHETFIPDALSRLDYSGLDLRHGQFHLVRFNRLSLNRANFSGSRHTQVYFHDAGLRNAQWHDAQINTDSFHPRSSAPPQSRPHEALTKLNRQQGHFAAIQSAAFSADGKRIVSASYDCTLKIWDANNGQCLLTLKGHQHWVQSAAFSFDGNRIVSASYDNTVRIWDADNGQCLLTLKWHQHWVESAAFSADAKRIVSASDDHTIKIWDADNGQCLLTLTGHQDSVRSAVFSADGNRIVSTSTDNTVKIWDADNGQCLLTLKGHQHWVLSAAFSSDDKRIVSASTDSTLKIWDAENGQCLLTLKSHQDWVRSAAFSADGKRIVSTSYDRTIKIWDADNGQCLLTLKGHQNWVQSAAFSADGKRIVSASDDHTIKIWDADNGQCLLTLKGNQRLVRSAAFSADGNRIVSASDDAAIKVWDAGNGQCLQTLKGHQDWVHSAAFSFDGKRIVTASDDSTLKIWDAGNGQCLLTLKGHHRSVRSAAFSFDGKRIVTASSDHTIKIWDAGNGQCLLTLEGHQHWVRSAAFSADDKRIVSASSDNTVKIWDADNGQCLLTLKGHQHWAQSAAFSFDGKRIVSASDDNTLKIWDADNGQCLQTLKGHKNSVRSAAFSTDGKRIVSASSDTTIKIWDADNGQCLLTLKGHQRSVQSAAFSSDAKRIVSASGDNTVKIWDAQSGELLLSLLSTGEGELVYRGDEEEQFEPTIITGNAWQYCFGLDAAGNRVHPSQYRHWDEIYRP